MAHFTIIGIISAILFLPTVLCRPLELPNDLLLEQSSQLASSPTTYHTTSFAQVSTPTSTRASSGTCPPLLGKPWYPEGCRPIDPSCWHPYPTSWLCPSGIYPPSPTPTYSTSYLTSYSKGWSPTTTGIVTSTATASILPSITLLSKREADELAVKKRRAFEGPRHYHFPHYWPHYSAALPVEHFESTLTSDPLSYISGTAYPTGTVIGSHHWVATGTAPASAWPWTSNHRISSTTSTLTLPVESGIGGVV